MIRRRWHVKVGHRAFLGSCFISAKGVVWSGRRALGVAARETCEHGVDEERLRSVRAGAASRVGLLQRGRFLRRVLSGIREAGGGDRQTGARNFAERLLRQRFIVPVDRIVHERTVRKFQYFCARPYVGRQEKTGQEASERGQGQADVAYRAQEAQTRGQRSRKKKNERIK